MKNQKAQQVLFSVMILLFFVLFFETTSFLALKLNNVTHFPRPWDVLLIFAAGFKISALLASLITAILFYSLFLIYLGGLERAFGKILISSLSIFMLANTLALAAFSFWKSTHLSLYPWVSYQLLACFGGTQFGFDFIICLMGSLVFCLSMVGFNFFIKYLPSRNIFGKAHFASAFEAHRAGLFASHGIILGKAFGKTLRLGGHEGVLITAPTGAGKTRSIAVPNLLEWQGSAVINDLKGELYLFTAAHREKNFK